MQEPSTGVSPSSTSAGAVLASHGKLSLNTKAKNWMGTLLMGVVLVEDTKSSI